MAKKFPVDRRQFLQGSGYLALSFSIPTATSSIGTTSCGRPRMAPVRAAIRAI